MGHFICGVLATYGLVVACGNMERTAIIDNNSAQNQGQNQQGGSGCPCIFGQGANTQGDNTQSLA